MARTEVFTGANGRLLLMPDFGTGGARAQAEATDAGVVGTAYLPTDFVVGRVTGVDVRVETDLEEFHEVGRRHPTTLHPGNIHISGRIERAHINGALLYYLLGRGASPNLTDEPYVQPNLAIELGLTDPALPGNKAAVEINGVKFENWAYSLPEDDFVMENVTFKALSIQARDTEEGTDQILEFPEAGGE